MKTRLSFTALALLLSVSGIAQISKVTDKLRSKLESVNKQLADAFLSEDVNKLMTLYMHDAIYLPEYQPIMKGTEAIRKYSQEIFNRQQIKLFDKKITEVIDFRGSVAEIGSFTIAYNTSGNGQLVRHNGKYLNIWKVLPDGTLRLKAESFGYFSNVENPASLVIKIPELPAANAIQSPDNDKSASFELHALNTLMEKAVSNRDSNLRADFFSQDAVFMPFADSLKVGMKAIRPYLIGYNSGNVTVDSIRIYTDYAEVLDSYVIEYPRFYVRWHTPELAGTGQGKGIRIWRRELDCSLKLYREIALHDHIE